MTFFAKPVAALLFATAAATVGCHAQIPAAGSKATGTLSPELYRRVELLVRQRAKVPVNYAVEIGPRTHSDFPGYDQIMVDFKLDGQSSPPVPFLLSSDGKTLAQFSKYDISKDPKTLVSSGGRPARGGPASAPVEIVGFDDLECPYCAKLHAQLFPALVARYGDKVHFVYRDFPLSEQMHPWAMRAAVDTNCLASQAGKPAGDAYWTLVDQIHAHAGEFGGTEHSLQKANEDLDRQTIDLAKKANLKQADVEACVKKQDRTPVEASVKQGETLGIEATPVLYINGEKIEGAVPVEYIFRVIDAALVAEGQTPPPAYVPPAPAAPAAKPGS